MKKLPIILLMLIVFSATQATNYYISTSGSDSNSGLTKELPWKSIYKIATRTFSKGDSILFKAGDVWINDGSSTSNDYALTINSTGTGTGNIVVSSYGSGNIPYLSGLRDYQNWNISTNWTEYSTGIWRNATGSPGVRLWLNGKEQKQSKTLALTSEFPWGADATYFYVKSPSNPATYFNSIKYPSYRASVIVSTGITDVIFSNLKIGGAKAIFQLNNNKNITIENCELGYRSNSNGIYMSATLNDSIKNIIIRNNKFETGDSLYYTYYRGGPNTGDAVWIGTGCVGVKVYNNYFDGWSHGAIGLYGTSNYPFHDNEVYNNFITAPLIDYARGVAAYFYSNGKNISIHDNTIVNTTVQNQLNGNGLKFYNNIIDNVAGCPYPEKAGAGNGIAIEGTSSPATNMEIYNNTITNCNYSGIRIYGESGDVIAKSGNNIHDNNIFNNGTAYNYQLIVFTSPTIINNIFSNNHFYKSSSASVISYRGVAYTSSSFNSVTPANGDVISSNDATLTYAVPIYGVKTAMTSDLKIEYNNTSISKTLSLVYPVFGALGGRYVTSVTLPKYSAMVLIKDASVTNNTNPTNKKSVLKNGSKYRRNPVTGKFYVR